MLKYALRILILCVLVIQSKPIISQNAIHAFENYNKGVSLYKIEEYDSAIYYFNEAIMLKPDLSRAYHNLAVVYYNQGDYINCISTINEYPDAGQTSKAYYLKARSFNLLNEIDSALYYYDKIISKTNKFPQAYFYKGIISYETEDYTTALSFFSEAISLDNLNSLYFYNRALTYEKLNLYSQAIDDYLTSLESFKDDVEILSNLGYCCFKNNNSKDGIKYLKNALEINPNYIPAYNNLGLIYLEQENYNDAISYFTSALKLDADNLVLLNNRGVSYYKLSSYDNALNDFNKILNFNPNDAKAYFNRGNIKENLLNIEGACEDWNKALLNGVDENVVPLNLCK